MRPTTPPLITVRPTTPPPRATTVVTLTLVTGNDGTEDDPVFELYGSFAGSPHRVVLNRSGTFRPNQTDTFQFTVPSEFCSITSYRLTKPAGKSGDDPWFLKEIYITLNGKLISFNRAVGSFSPITSTSFPPNGNWTGTALYKELCPK